MIIQAFIRGAIVIGLAAIITFVLRNRSAALRHHIWATAVVVQLALLAFIPVLPTITLPIVPVIQVDEDAPFASAFNAEEVATREQESTRAREHETASPTAPANTNGTIAQSKRTRSLSDYLFLIWIAGGALILARFLIGTLLMARTAFKGERVDDGEWLVLAQRIARELGITRPVTMIWGDKVSVPITWGVLYPMILLPESAREWPTERRRFVLVHEMAHVKRFDALTQFLAQITAAIFWFSPFVWIADWRMRIEREHACDDTVLQHGTEPTLYADELLQMVRSLVRRRAAQPAFAALAMARKSEFEGRMLAILDPERPRAVTGIMSGVAFAVLSLLIAAPVAAIDPFAFRVVTKPAAPTDYPTEPITGPPPPTVKASTPVVSTTTSHECRFDGTTIGTHANVSDDKLRIDVQLHRPDRCIFTELRRVKLSADERRILEVPAGGYASVREVTRERDIVLNIEHLSTGDVRRSFTINGRVPDDDGSTERTWLARVLPQALAEGSINPAARVSRLLKSNGLDGTLSDIAELRSPQARRYHFVALVKANDWSDAELSRITTVIRRSLYGRDLEEALKAVPPKAATKAATSEKKAVEVKTDKELLEGLLLGFTSAYDLRMAMLSQVPKADKETLLMFTQHVPRMGGSSYEAAEFLIGSKIPYLHHKDDALAASWFRAASSILSSYERSRVLFSAFEYVQGSEARTLMLLRATANMSSNSDKAGVLAKVAKAKLIDTPALRTEFLVQANTITTADFRRAVLEALQ
jgi:beta-lactamase regulating signal transducer with metallopeptidase domain